MAAVELTNRNLIHLFQEVDARLYVMTSSCHSVLIVGGAAVALLWNDQRMTNDVDVVSEGFTPELRSAIAQVAQDYDLEPDWFNDAAKIKGPALQPENPILVFDGTRLRVFAAPARYVLAMKLMSARRIDRYDIPALLVASEVESKEELYQLVEDAYPRRFIRAATSYIIDQVWDMYGQGETE